MTEYFLYFAGFDGRVEQVGVARSNDQQHWEITPHPAIPTGEGWDAAQTSNPCVILENGVYRMWYQGVDSDGRYRIGYAESADGWDWQKKPEVMFERPGLAEQTDIPWREGYHQPLVVQEANRYLMYFVDYHNKIGSIRVAESADGLVWNIAPEKCLSPERDWETRGLHYPWVLHDGQQYVMWYTSANEKRWYLSRAVSSDGFSWQREPEKPVISFETTRPASKGHLWMPRRLLDFFPNYRHPSIREAKGWTKPTSPVKKILLNFYDEVIFPFRSKRYVSFNNSSVVRQADGGYLMYFQSRDENAVLSIGTAVSSDGIHWRATGTNILRPTIEREQIAWCSLFDADPHLLVVNHD
jgi:predicted GH43/DUF377 family glycosyl hydrolase